MNSDLATRAGNLLLQNNFTVAVAESCTGGALTDRLTDVAGSSRYVLGAVVSYAAATRSHISDNRTAGKLQCTVITYTTSPIITITTGNITATNGNISKFLIRHTVN